MMHITEDTPPDMLTGAMDLTVHLPSGKTVQMSVERGTPMMDVLVLVTTRYNLQVSRYAIEALAMAPNKPTILSYRPNTPLGALDTQHIRIVAKQRAAAVVAPPPRAVKHVTGHQPFESTFRLKVHLPKNQLYVIRVSRHIHLGDIMAKVCEDKNLDGRKYEFRHPGNLDQILDATLTLSDYQITEVYVVVRGTLTAFSTNDIMALRRDEEKKQMHTKAGGGVFNLIFNKKGRNSLEYGSITSENRSVSPSHSDDTRSVTPPNKPKDQPKPPQRKRKLAPKPPTQPTEHITQPATTTIQSTSSTEAVDIIPATNVICHSRTSSDSSGYHEASILSDNLINNSSLPRAHHRLKEQIDVRSKSTGNLTTLLSNSKSTTSLMVTGRKKKAAPLPPTTPNSCVVNQFEMSDGNDISPPVTSHNLVNQPDIIDTLSENILSGTQSSSIVATESNISSLNDHIINTQQNDDTNVEWKYELPLPPSAFRDIEHHDDDNTTMLISERFRGEDSVDLNHPQFDKGAQSDTTTESVPGTEDVYNKLSLELLQKRKSLVYNRELATSLKSPDSANKTRGLPNFKITTYDEPKSKINIYEDDTISSNQSIITNNDLTYKTGSLMRSHHHQMAVAADYTPVVRSGSFSINTWSAGKLVNRREDSPEVKETTADAAGGLQSLGVMKLIRNSLQAPTVAATEHDINNICTHNCNTLMNKNTTAVLSKRWSPPALTLGTWSDRPKSDVIVKRDSDYKFNILSAGVQNNTNSNRAVVVNNIEHRDSFVSKNNRGETCFNNNNNISVKINGSEPTIIRVGSSTNTFTRRKAFADINNARTTVRPHSIAIDAIEDYDVSRRPVVKSATLKKSITQINNYCTSPRPNSVYLLNNQNGTVRDYSKDGNYSTNINVPFSQLRLKRTDSNRILTESSREMGFGRVLDTVPLSVDKVEIKRQQNGTYCPPPPPPKMPSNKIVFKPQKQRADSCEDTRAALLSAIQNFGGKNGLRSIRA